MNSTTSKAEVMAKIQETLSEMFEIDKSIIVAEARIYEDLDLDSIDAVDLVVSLQQLTGKRFKAEEFKSIRTVDDMADTICRILKNEAE